MEKLPASDPERQKELRRRYEDEFIKINRFQGRNKFELYIHSKELRAIIAVENVKVWNEEKDQVIDLSKKHLFYSWEYGEYLKEVCRKVAEGEGYQSPADK